MVNKYWYTMANIAKIQLHSTKNGKKSRKIASFPSEYQYFNKNMRQKKRVKNQEAHAFLILNS